MIVLQGLGEVISAKSDVIQGVDEVSPTARACLVSRISRKRTRGEESALMYGTLLIMVWRLGAV